MAEKPTRIATVNHDRCKPKKCHQECKKSCPVVRMGKLCIEVTPYSATASMSESLCIGCGICTKVHAFRLASFGSETPTFTRSSSATSSGPCRSGPPPPRQRGLKSLCTGMRRFLEPLGTSFRRDPKNSRRRINKPNSNKDREQKKTGNYFRPNE